ncbi:hypothetical protein F4803DRAFT_547104 [Xylaria telfairii]|nr:hypothetical protein F4803DRAFT_547104 [Xylaria telfairii]
MLTCLLRSGEGCVQIRHDQTNKKLSVIVDRLKIRETVIANKPPPLLNIQANTFVKWNSIVLKEYELTYEGIIESWYDRAV